MELSRAFGGEREKVLRVWLFSLKKVTPIGMHFDAGKLMIVQPSAT
jgi:hypothetical protein